MNKEIFKKLWDDKIRIIQLDDLVQSDDKIKATAQFKDSLLDTVFFFEADISESGADFSFSCVARKKNPIVILDFSNHNPYYAVSYQEGKIVIHRHEFSMKDEAEAIDKVSFFFLCFMQGNVNEMKTLLRGVK